MDKEGILRKAVELIVIQLQVDESDVVFDAHLVDDLGADSLDLVELSMAMEEAFNINLPDEEVEKIRTVGDIVSVIERNLANET
jgi:acyl carrier protein